MNHSHITASHAAFFGCWLLVCIGACFLAAQWTLIGTRPFFSPDLLPLGMFVHILAGQFFLLRTIIDRPMKVYLGCLVLPLCVFITGIIGHIIFISARSVEIGSNWWSLLLYIIIVGAFFGLCQVITMPPHPRLVLLWPLCTAASAAIGLGAIYLLAPTTMIMGPRLGASNTRWYDFAALATAFGAIFGLTSGIALTWLYRELIGGRWYSSPIFYISELCISLIIGFFACSWSTTTNQSIFPKTRPDTFSVEYRTSNRSYGRHILLSAEECSYTAGSDYAYNESDRLIDTRCSLSSEDLDHLFAAMKSVNIDRIPYLDKFAFLTFDQAWEYLTFTIDGASYELSFNSDLEDLTPEQQQRWLDVLDTIDEICQKNLPQVVVKRTPGP